MTSASPPVVAPISLAWRTTCSSGSKPGGLATCTRTPAERAGQQQRVGHVVAVAHVGERAALQVALELAQRLEVGERLAGMGEIGERVDRPARRTPAASSSSRS